MSAAEPGHTKLLRGQLLHRIGQFCERTCCGGNLRGLRRQIVQMIARSETGILLTSYDQLRLQRQLLLGVNWGYAILDEGHKIRNPDAEARRAP